MDDGGKRVSWVELYLDLVFVLAVGQLAHLIVGEPEMRSVWIALGLFFTLWWTWVGFAVLYNRTGADEPAQRLLFLVASVPAGVAAVAVDPASTGDSAVFAASLAVTRLVLAVAHGANRSLADMLRLRIARACLTSAALFALSIWAPEPFRYLLWAVAIGIESGALLEEDRERMHALRRDRDLTALAPEDPSEALDPHHFAERFGLFFIILLGEVVVEAGQASVDGHVATAAGWAALVAAMILAAALWWVYFDSAAGINLKVLELSGGSPTMARAIFAVGHMLPAFSLLVTAAGVGLLLEEDPPRIAYWLACVGIGIYLLGTRVFLVASRRVSGLARALLLVATFQLARLEGELSAHAYLWLLTGWVVM
jgi:low temperature requirement protein LtrA